MKDLRPRPRRPYITPAFSCALAFWATCACSLNALEAASSSTCLRLALLGGLAAFACLLASVLRVKTAFAFVLASALAGACLAACQSYSVTSAADRFCNETVRGAEAVLLEDASTSSFGSQALSSVDLNGAHLKVLVQFRDNTEWLVGTHLRLSGSLKAAKPTSSSFCWRKGTKLCLSATDVHNAGYRGPIATLHQIRAEALKALGTDGDGAAVIGALACGFRAPLSGSSLYGSYQTCGLAHLVAVSGAHLVIVTSLLAALLKTLKVARWASICLLVGLMASYCVLSGLSVSCIRAALMSSIGILSLLGKRRPSALNSLGIGMSAMISSDPSTALSASFSLSVLSTAGIVIFAPLVSSALEGILRARIPLVAEPLALTLSAAVPSQFFACSLFGQMPLISPLANVVTAPLFAPACALALLDVLAGAAHLAIFPVVHTIAIICIDVLDSLVSSLAKIPYASIPASIDTFAALTLSLALSAFLWAFWDRLLKPRTFSALACGALACVVSLTVAIPHDSIALLDVGQGDAFLVTSGGTSLLIDTGNQDTRLLEQLARMHVAHLDAVALTHADDDHFGSLDALGRCVVVDEVLVAEGMLLSADASCKTLVAQAKSTAAHISGLEVGDEIRVGRFVLEVLWPYCFTDDGGNADSLVMLAHYDADGDGVDEARALFTGDAEIDQLDALNLDETIGHVDVLKVGHHGSRNAMTEQQLSTLSPAIALIGVGQHNRYGHPTPEICAMLDNIGAKTYRSDKDGGVRLDFMSSTVTAHYL